MQRPDLFKYRKQFIRSMKELINRYKEAIKQETDKLTIERRNNQYCLLCHPIGVEYGHNCRRGTTHKEQCEDLGCPWLVILGHTCDEDCRLNDEYDTIYHSTDPERQQKRIDQLYEWIELYKNYKGDKNASRKPD